VNRSVESGLVKNPEPERHHLLSPCVSHRRRSSSPPGGLGGCITVLLAVFIFIVFTLPAGALVFPETELKVFQFPPDQIPRIDGDPSDWDIVPDDYIYGTDLLLDVENDRNAPMDPKDLDVKVRVGWVEGMNRLYFLYEAYDNYWDFEGAGLHNDMFEITVDADLSGGEFVYEDYPRRILLRTCHAQNHHILTPAVGKSPAMVWNCPAWVSKLPWANYVCRYAFRQGESGRLVMECWITPFDLVSADGPEQARVSELRENAVIGLSWLTADWDGPGNRHALPCLSHDVRQVHDATFLCPFHLMPLEERFKKPFQAFYTFRIVDAERRVVSFFDRSRGEITGWRWEFGDGAESVEQNPVHRYEQSGEYDVTLTVRGPSGTSRFTTLWEVLLK
jgi:hypothetical protein